MEIPTPMSPVADLASRHRCAPSGAAKDIDSAAAKQPSAVASDQGAQQTSVSETSRGTSEGEVSAAVTWLNDYVQAIQRTLNFSENEDTGETAITVIDTNSKEVIREIPAQDALSMLKYISADANDSRKLPKGVFVWEKA